MLGLNGCRRFRFRSIGVLYPASLQFLLYGLGDLYHATLVHLTVVEAVGHFHGF